MKKDKVVSREEWLESRRRLLAAEKDFTERRDALSAARRELPAVQVATSYVFQSSNGKTTLADLFAEHSQLIVQHFMMGKEWDEGCPSCSLWADSFNGTTMHMAARDAAFVCVSNAPIEKISAYKERMGWTFDWVSCAGNTFNFDFSVSFTEQELSDGPVEYNYQQTTTAIPELPGISIFLKDSTQIYHTYSCYSRGLDNMNSTYQYLDLLPKGRDEDALDYPMAWVRRHDQY